MSLARDALIKRLESISAILANPLSHDTSPTPDPGSIAATSRNGLTVMIFCALEAFVRDRSTECGDHLSKRKVPFSLLPTAMQDAALVRQFEVLAKKTRIPNRTIEFQNQIKSAARSANGIGLGVTKHAFSPSGSNVQDGELDSLAKMFGAKTFFAESDKIIKHAKLSFGSLSSKGAFERLRDARHSCAHNSAHIETHSSVISYLSWATLLCFAFDCICSIGANHLTSAASTASPPIQFNKFPIVTYGPSINGAWKNPITASGSVKPANFRSFSRLSAFLTLNLAKNGGIAMEHGNNGLLKSWITCCP